jgi:hypothetical protein
MDASRERVEISWGIMELSLFECLISIVSRFIFKIPRAKESAATGSGSNSLLSDKNTFVGCPSRLIQLPTIWRHKSQLHSLDYYINACITPRTVFFT